MALTLGELASLPELNLEVVAGTAQIHRIVRWVHTSELPDPTPWLTGGELLLTTGMRLNAGAAQRRFVARLAEAGLAGLGFGTGFGFEQVPAEIRRAGDEIGFPVLAVPYETPFIAISKAVSSTLTQDRVRDAETSLDVHRRLAAAMSEGAGAADLLDEIGDIVGGWLVLFDLRGEVISTSAESTGGPEPSWIWSELPASTTGRSSPGVSSHIDQAGGWIALPVFAGGRKEGVLVLGKKARLDHRDRIAAHVAVNALGLVLSSRRAIAEAERRVAGDVITEAVSGRLSGRVLARRLELLNFAAGSRSTVLVVEPLRVLTSGDVDELAWIVDTALGARGTVRTAAVDGSVVALLRHDDPAHAARVLFEELASAGYPSRVAIGRTGPPVALRDSYTAAVLALRTSARDIVRPEDVSSYGVLLGACPRPVVDAFVRSVLGGLVDGGHGRSDDLVASVKAFVRAGGRWEQAARDVGVHRHTLRYRIRRAEEIMERDLSSGEDRLEVFIALKALEALRPDGSLP